MDLIVMRPTSQETHTVAWIEVDTTLGNYVIQPGHAPVMLILASNKSVICMLKSGKQRIIKATGGILHVTRTQATILLDT